MSEYTEKNVRTQAPKMISELCEKYGWVEFTNESYPNELIFKHNTQEQYIYISLEDEAYYLSTPMRYSNCNMKVNCGFRGDSAVFYTIYDRLESKLQYLDETD